MANVPFNVGFGNRTINRDHKFKDLALDIRVDPIDRDIKDLTDISAINNSVANLFFWRQGTRILLPEYGNSLYQYLAEPINPLTARNIGNEIQNLFEQWEPRVLVENITIIPNADQHEYNITIFYSVPAFPTRNLQFTTVLNQRTFGN